MHTLTITDPDPSAADLAIQAIPGGMSVYTLTVRNLGPGPATGIVLTDVLPSGVTPLWAQPAQPLCGRQESNVACDLGELWEGDTATATLDLSVGGSESLVTGTQLAGLTLDLSWPTCAIDQNSATLHVTCRLARLRPGAEAQVRIGVGVHASISGSLVHTTTVVANEPDPDRSNNGATSTLMARAVGPMAVTAIPSATDLVLQADGPSTVIAGQPFTYTYTITNQGAMDATGVWFEDVVPADLNLVAYAPGLPLCGQQDDTLVCHLRDVDSRQTVTLALAITGHGGQPIQLGLDPLMPGWPICLVVQERTWQHVVHCELGGLKPGQATHVQLVLMAVGVVERMTTNTASVRANEAERNPLDNTNTTTMTVQVEADLSVQSAISGPALTGRTLTLTLTVANLGPSDADDVVVTEVLPLGTSLVSAIPGQGDDCRLERDDASADGRTENSHVVCGLGRLSGGETAVVTIVIMVDQSLLPAVTQAISHSARVMAKPADPNPSNNALRESIPVSTGGGE